ncbi:Auxin efflux carrier [Carpediemonas membranifera]|uniref:Auxin efflux carrier n=1 Tax=Carpediemonas membranifera TaxID=201153 RepID=A0A8J6E385_9EUKA|nr:Auxin efflux carrier [Carpediemonas membranifera]|eukprot:KAG9392812.1 Auxin efflux carrier [Carpediemonas membranifera]
MMSFSSLVSLLGEVLWSTMKSAIPLLFLIALGFYFGKSGRMGAKHVEHLNQYVFKIALVTIGFANVLQSDPFTFPDLIFIFDAALCTVFNLFAAIPFTLIQPKRDRTLSFYAMTVMMSTWPNSIIVGQPVLQAIKGEAVAVHYPILYVVSNMLFSIPLFQTLYNALLPTEKFLNERKSQKLAEKAMTDPESGMITTACPTTCNSDSEVESVASGVLGLQSIPVSTNPSRRNSMPHLPSVDDEVYPAMHHSDAVEPHTPAEPTDWDHRPDHSNMVPEPIGQTDSDSDHGPCEGEVPAPDEAAVTVVAPQPTPLLLRAAKVVWHFTLHTYILNPFVIMMLVGLIWKISTVPVPYLVLTPAKWLAGTCTPVGMFTIGVFVAINPIELHIRTSVLFLFMRQILTPIFMTVLVLITGLSGERAIAAIISASMPVALNAFTFSKQYENRTENVPPVVVGSIFLMIPVFSFIFAMEEILVV